MKTLQTGIVILAALLLGACATQGEREELPLTYPDGEKLTLVAHKQWSPDWLLDGSKMKLNYIVKGDVTPKQLAAVAKTEEACRIFTEKVRPNDLVAVFATGVLYTAAGYVGVGLGAKAFTGVSSSQYARYGAAATGMAGAANGVITLGGKTYTFENCGREALSIVSQYGVRVLNKSPY